MSAICEMFLCACVTRVPIVSLLSPFRTISNVIQALRRELEHLDRLVAGYQKENEKLMDQTRKASCLCMPFLQANDS